MNDVQNPIYSNMRLINAKLPHFYESTRVGSTPVREDHKEYPKPSTFNLHLRSGRVVLFLGDSGSGKSTLMRCIAGFKDLEEGEIDLQEKQVAMLLQNPFHQIIMQKAHDELFFPQKNAGIETESAENEIAKICKILEITHLLERNINTLSFGEAQLLMIAATALTPADIYLFDEPTSHLDPPHISRFYTLLSILAEKGKTVVVSTQNTDEYRYAARMIILDKGNLKADYSKDEIEKLVKRGDFTTDVEMIIAKLGGLKK